MDRPLWQTILTLLVLGFLVERGTIASVLYLEGAAEPLLLAGYALQLAAGLATALGLWLGRLWACGAVLLLGAAVAATAFLEVGLGIRPALAAVTQVLVAALSAGALFVILKREFGSADLRSPPS